MGDYKTVNEKYLQKRCGREVEGKETRILVNK
jgi:hypothetical protein